ncbi:hypothetical protein CVIRNUC_011024 [Coccomyxa viridis]|uniref:Uncharacterized protein n=1 Tax=Coccomyxa viridis TaxID=1274662 RepID=A0AAV1IKL0_9CHLO|nr:hypothetical protein CVIRNUC_011024 [Coccomyxa viridis]
MVFPLLRRRLALKLFADAFKSSRRSLVQDITGAKILPRHIIGHRSFSPSSVRSGTLGHNLWGKSIHIPDIPAWALVTGGLGAGGLFYYYNYHSKKPHMYAGDDGRHFVPAAVLDAPRPVAAASAPLPEYLPPFKATDVVSGTTVTPDDLAGKPVVLIFVDPSDPDAALNGLARLQEVTSQAGRASKMQLQPVAVDKTAGKGDGGRGLKQLLAGLAEEIKKDGKKAAQMPAIRGLTGDEAVSKIQHSVQHFAEEPPAQAAAVKPEAVSEEGVLHLFGPDGMLIIQYDATLVPADVARSVLKEVQKYEQGQPAHQAPGKTTECPA